jgi:hypothetical protein
MDFPLRSLNWASTNLFGTAGAPRADLRRSLQERLDQNTSFGLVLLNYISKDLGLCNVPAAACTCHVRSVCHVRMMRSAQATTAECALSGGSAFKLLRRTIRGPNVQFHLFGGVHPKERAQQDKCTRSLTRASDERRIAPVTEASEPSHA